MAVLQAARAYILGFDESLAKSWGLNRAIFYAAAKKGVKKTPLQLKTELKQILLRERRLPQEEITKIQQSFQVINRLGDEMAYSIEIDNKLYFTIGDKIQTEEEFAKQIESRFSGKFNQAWQEALDICKSYDKGVLLSQRYFFETVYKPRRDELAKKWSQL
jgi:hypothetical protein